MGISAGAEPMLYIYAYQGDAEDDIEHDEDGVEDYADERAFAHAFCAEGVLRAPHEIEDQARERDEKPEQTPTERRSVVGIGARLLRGRIGRRIILLRRRSVLPAGCVGGKVFRKRVVRGAALFLPGRAIAPLHFNGRPASGTELAAFVELVAAMLAIHREPPFNGVYDHYTLCTHPAQAVRLTQARSE